MKNSVVHDLPCEENNGSAAMNPIRPLNSIVHGERIGRRDKYPVPAAALQRGLSMPGVKSMMEVIADA